MNVNKLITDTLSPLGYPVQFQGYQPLTGQSASPTYITYNYSDDRAVEYADDEPQTDLAVMQVHLFIPDSINHVTLKKQIRSRLFKAGFSYPVIITEYEDENKLFHLIFECEIEGKSETEVL